MDVAGVDGCKAGWLCLYRRDEEISGEIFATFQQLLEQLPPSATVAVDIPIGLPAAGERECDRTARQLLGRPRASSVFPAPVLAVVHETDYQSACAKHRGVDGRALSRQAFAILPKILEVNRLLWSRVDLQARIKEMHPEMSFAEWNNHRAMQHRKSSSSGALAREELIDRLWPDQRTNVLRSLGRTGYRRDDLNDAFAALWSADRVVSGAARVLGAGRDQKGLSMQMWV
jgi:predicted RNase H-like nuclease